MSNFTPKVSQRKEREQELTDKQKKLLELALKYNGDAIRAARDAGYANPYAAVNGLKDELIEMAEQHLARLALKSTSALERALDSEDVIVQLPEKLKAAFGVLDRTNPKVNKLDVSGEGAASIFILPEKVKLVDGGEDEQE